MQQKQQDTTQYDTVNIECRYCGKPEVWCEELSACLDCYREGVPALFANVN